MLTSGNPVGDIQALFPRIEVAKSSQIENRQDPVDSEKTGIAEIEFAEFSKVNLKTARIIRAEPVEKTKRLLECREPFILMKPANAQFCRIASKLSEPEIKFNSSIHQHLAYSFISDVTRYLIENNSRSHRIDKSEGLEKAIAILDEEFMLPPTITQLSRRVGTNETSLKQWFRKEFNTTIHQYVIQQRMTKAVELISIGAFPICHVAQEVGYSNPGHFAAAFKKELGCKPSCFLSSNQKPARPTFTCY